MISKSLDDLLPEIATAARRAIAECKAQGIELIVTCTYRSPKQQEIEYKKKSTKARAWQSYHQYKRALDICVKNDKGELIWNPKTKEEWAKWNTAGAIFQSHGFEWAKNWKSFPELAHFQITGGKDWATLMHEMKMSIGQVTNLPAGYDN